ncbi:MAG: cytochrome c maturation protein CcmE [Gemmatimonadota bacterium]
MTGAAGASGGGPANLGRARAAGARRGKRRLWAAVGLTAVVGAILLLVLGGLRENVVYFLTPAELLAENAGLTGQAVRLGGQVQPESVSWDAETRDLQFLLTDGEASVRVRSTGAPPAMFREGLGVVVEGRLNSEGVFESTNVMVKHSNEYRPPPEGEKPAHVFESLIQEKEGG